MSKVALHPTPAAAPEANGYAKPAGAALEALRTSLTQRSNNVVLMLKRGEKTKGEQQKAIERNDKTIATRGLLVERIEALRALQEAFIDELRSLAVLAEASAMQRDHATHKQWKDARAAQEWAHDAERSLELGLIQAERAIRLAVTAEEDTRA